MRRIDMRTWPRRQHFEFFNTFDNPYFGMCANVDLSKFYPFMKQHGYSNNIGIIYLIARTANTIPEFRFRLREGEVVEHEVVHPASTILSTGNLFNFCTFDYIEDFSTFEARAKMQIARTQQDSALQTKPGQDDLLYMTAIPWVSFTKFMHPMHFHPTDSVPRFAWGKFFNDGDRLLMPLDVQAHHALMDGFHIGQFFEKVQDFFHNPDSVLGKSKQPG
jgi:chloramphenicol O-acetyltransferase type A